jgi:hypothetical protein
MPVAAAIVCLAVFSKRKAAQTQGGTGTMFVLSPAIQILLVYWGVPYTSAPCFESDSLSDTL